MAIEKGHLDAMYNLGDYYENIVYNYDLMKKYYLMAIEKGNLDAMHRLGLYYETNHYNYNLMKKYYLLCYRFKYNIHFISSIYYYYKSYNYNNL